jgi:glycine hydroxymethyltransferase
LEAVGITLNKNAIPDDPLPPFQASGVRLGTPAATSRGLGEPDMMKIAGWIAAVGKGGHDAARLRAEVRELCLAHPIPSGRVEEA